MCYLFARGDDSHRFYAHTHRADRLDAAPCWGQYLATCIRRLSAVSSAQDITRAMTLTLCSCQRDNTIDRLTVCQHGRRFPREIMLYWENGS